jgi:hypothetical protein
MGRPIFRVPADLTLLGTRRFEGTGCDDSGPVVALNRNGDEFVSLAKVIVAARDGEAPACTADAGASPHPGRSVV